MSVFISPDSLCQIEIYVSELKTSLEFYEKVFGWKKVPAYIHNLCVLDVNSSKVGVALVPSKLKAAQKSTFYFSVESSEIIEAVISEAKSLTGRSSREEKTLPSFGRVSYVIDPDGHRIGLFVPENGAA